MGGLLEEQWEGDSRLARQTDTVRLPKMQRSQVQGQSQQCLEALRWSQALG